MSEMQGLGSRPDDEAHLPWALWFQEDTDALPLPVKESSKDANFLAPREDDGRKMGCFKTSKEICETGPLRDDVRGMMSYLT